MTKYNFKKKFKFNDPNLSEFFVKNGYVVLKDLFDKKKINALANFCKKKIEKLEILYKKKKN